MAQWVASTGLPAAVAGTLRLGWRRKGCTHVLVQGCMDPHQHSHSNTSLSLVLHTAFVKRFGSKLSDMYASNCSDS